MGLCLISRADLVENPTMVSSAFCALAWIHANAETYGFDPQRIVVFGHSMGGQSAAPLGSVDDATGFMKGCSHQLPVSGWTKTVVAYGGLFGTPERHLVTTHFQISTDIFGIPRDEGAEIRQTLLDTPPQGWRDISGFNENGTLFLHSLPLYWIDGSEPPFLLMHGDEDLKVDSAEPEAFEAHLHTAGVEAEVALISNGGHMDITLLEGPGFEDAVQAMEVFFGKSVGIAGYLGVPNARVPVNVDRW